MPTVQKIVGHKSAQTTLAYYNWVSDEDMRAGVAKVRQAAG